LDATTLLREDHEALRALFRAYVGSTDLEARRRAVKDIKTILEMHSRIEEEVFYPAVMRVRSEHARDCVRDCLEEHHQVDGLVAELDQLEPDDAVFDAKVRALQDNVERHLRQEEDGMFAEARIHLTDERLERLGREMAALRESTAAVRPSDRETMGRSL
jgi:iron-sulfur cluster repair protein YtfE (RIC family)